MDDAALARGHRAEVVRSSRPANLLGCDVGRGAQLLNAQGAAILAVEADFLVLPGSKVEHLEREQFKRAQQFSAAIEQKRGVGAGKVDENFRLFPVAILRERWVDDDAVLEVKTAVSDDGLKELVDLIGGSDFVHKKPSAISRPLSANGSAGISIQCRESFPKGLKPRSIFVSQAALKRRSSTTLIAPGSKAILNSLISSGPLRADG